MGNSHVFSGPCIQKLNEIGFTWELHTDWESRIRQAIYRPFTRTVGGFPFCILLPLLNIEWCGHHSYGGSEPCTGTAMYRSNIVWKLPRRRLRLLRTLKLMPKTQRR